MPNEQVQRPAQPVRCNALLGGRARYQREGGGLSNGFDGEIDIEAWPIEAVCGRHCDRDNLIDRCASKPGKLSVRDEQLFCSYV